MRTEAYLRLVWNSEANDGDAHPPPSASLRLLTPPPHAEAHGEVSRDSKHEVGDGGAASFTPILPLYTPPHLPMMSAPRRRGPRPVTLAGLAVFIAGMLIAAQAAFMPAKAEVSQILMNRAWEARLASGEAARPWPWADFSPEARLTFPDSDGGVRHVLALTDAAGESLAFGPTRMAASAQPGEPGVAVYAAHRDTHFSFLDRLKPGDPVIVETPDRKLTFNVIGSSVVRWNASGVRPHDAGRPRIALVTCWPLDAKFQGPMRYIVWAELSEETPSSSPSS